MQGQYKVIEKLDQKLQLNQMNTYFKIAFLLGVILTSVAFVYILPQQSEVNAKLNNLIFKDLIIDFSRQESKWILVRAIILRLSLFLLLHTCGVMLFRIILGRSSPATKEDTTAIKLLNNIIQNTIEQSFIFLGFYIYFLFDGPSQKISPQNLLNIATWFVFGRILFSMGYIFGTFIELPQLRTYGFSLSAFVNVLLFEQLFLNTQVISQTFLH